jgi:hypothetical protein
LLDRQKDFNSLFGRFGLSLTNVSLVGFRQTLEDTNDFIHMAYFMLKPGNLCRLQGRFANRLRDSHSERHRDSAPVAVDYCCWADGFGSDSHLFPFDFDHHIVELGNPTFDV